MFEKEQWIPYIVIVTIVIFSLVALIFLGSGSKEPYDPSSSKETYEPPCDFQIYNYLPNHSIKVDVLSADGQKNIVPKVLPLNSKGIPKDVVRRCLGPGNVVRIYILMRDEPELFADYVIDTEKQERIKSLHVGMITTRFIGDPNTKLNDSVVAENSTGGLPYITVHNTTYVPLSLNKGKIRVFPHSTAIYQGPILHSGVPLGLYLKDDEKLYPEFQYLQPHSDVYYGVCSDLQQPLHGCWQLEFNDYCPYGQTLWPFQDGVM
jgi:hypothetical protein